MTHRARVLVVDSDLDALYYVDDVLSELGYYPIKATTTEDAAEIIGALSLDAVVINMEMVAGTQETALSQLEQAGDNTAVLVMTRSGLTPDATATPLRGFLEHPPSTEELARALEICGRSPLRSAR